MSESDKTCKVKGCSGEALHVLPRNVDKRRIWTDALNLEDVIYAPKTPVMCTEHFQMLDSIDVSSIIVSSSKGSSTTSGCSYGEDDKMNVTTGSFKSVGNISALSNTSGISSYDESDFPPDVNVTKGKVPFSAMKRKSSLSSKATTYLKAWLSQHIHHPYPTDKEKIEISAETGLTTKQVANWFINARRRIIKPMLDSPDGIPVSSPSLADVNAPVGLTLQEIGFIPRKKPILKTKTKKKVDTTQCIDSSEIPSSTSSCPSIFDVDAPEPVLQGVPSAKKPRKILPPKAQKKKEVNVLAAATTFIDLTETPNTTDVSSSVPDSSSSLINGVVSKEIPVQKSLKKEPAKRGVIRKPKSNGKKILKVVIPGPNAGRVKFKKRFKTVTSTVSDTQLQSEATTAKHTIPANNKSAKFVSRPKPVSAPAAVEVRPVHPPLPYQNGITLGMSPGGGIPGEDLLDSLYEELYINSDTKSEDDDSVEVVGGPASTSRTCETQTCYDLQHRETQTSMDVETPSGVRIAALSYHMYQNRPDWVKYHTGLANYDQFKLVLDSLGPGVYYLADRYGTPDKPLCVEDQLLMTLMKLRRAEPDLGIGMVFGTPKKTVEDIVKTWTNIMYRRWSVPDVWPTQDLTARKVCRSVEGPNGTQSPQVNGEKPSDIAALERVRKLYKILNVNLTLHKPFSDNVLFVCCTLHDFRGGIITTRKP
ncbi:hypothetical protein GE061_002498 [Apolygus lucorum]|uniref:Homeobox domain-containing protein n=1 Tax=Apolygus lucorum TaxID=248454 RepID=A0A8S9X717_APOLU|nr:hypothetical protein GE061_002498 [Apolygus lucorum]